MVNLHKNYKIIVVDIVKMRNLQYTNIQDYKFFLKNKRGDKNGKNVLYRSKNKHNTGDKRI